MLGGIRRTCRWWTPELSRMKAEMVRRRRRIVKAAPRRREFVVEQYLAIRADYRRAIETAMTDSWKKFCTDAKTETIWEKSYRVMKACSAGARDVLLEDGGGTVLEPFESASLLADVFYPRDDPAMDTSEQARLRAEVARLREELRERDAAPEERAAFTPTELETVLRAMSPKKAPGGDGLTLDICLKAFVCNKALLLQLFSQCLRWGCFPRIWKVATVKVIPKPARASYVTPKSYRPIGLLPVLGKILEKLFVGRLQWQLGRDGRLSPYQYGFTPQRGTEDALFDAMTEIKKNVINKNIVVMVSLDIEGAFDNAWWPAILAQLRAERVDPLLVRLIDDYLLERRIRLRYAGETVDRDTERGCIQGSVCGPILWNIQLGPLLEQTQYGGVRVQAFADDIVLIAAARDGHELEGKINRALAVILQWGESLKLKFSPGKTQAIIITKKLVYHTPRLQMAGVELEYGTSLKILGLTVDPLLNFRLHLEAVNKKAIALYRVVSRAARAQWGLNSEILRLIYICVIEPTVLYAASCWADVVDRVYAETALDRLTRSFALRISKAHRTTSLVSSVLLARILPLSLRVREHDSVFHIKRRGQLSCLPGRTIERRRSPHSLPHPADRRRLEFSLVGSREDVDDLESDGPVLYTDGSKLEDKVGGAVSCWKGGTEVRHTAFRLESFCSVFQAELVAIQQALIIVRGRREVAYSIASDSRSGLDAICDPNTINPLAVDIREEILKLENEGKEITLFWVRAHCGIPGNERADELAKYAALHNRQLPKYDRFPLSYAKRSTRADTVEEWQRRYDAAATGSTTKLFFKNVAQSYKILAKIKINNYVAQILTGHGGFKAYLHRFKLTDSPLCSCGDDVYQTVEHVLTNCPKFGLIRYNCESAMELDIRVENFEFIMSDDDCRPKFLSFMKTVLQKLGKENNSFLESD